MKLLRSASGLRITAFMAWLVMQFIGHTCRLKVIGFDKVRALQKEGKGFIMAVWHGRTLLPIFFVRGMGFWAITSLSIDGEIQTHVVSRCGFKIIRGSTGRGAVKAGLLAAKRLEEGGILTITPDGPLGPPNEVQEGIVFLAHRAQCPVIPVGVGISRRKILNAWDSYAVPMPFARGAIVFGDPIYVPDDKADPSPRLIIKEALDKMQAEAQALAKEGS